MKKIIGILLSIVISASLIGCKKDEDKSEDVSSKTKTEESSSKKEDDKKDKEKEEAEAKKAEEKKEAEAKKAAEKDILEVLEANTEAMNDGDLEAYMATISKSSKAVYDATEAQMIESFEKVTFEVKISNEKVKVLTETTAEVTATQETFMTNKADKQRMSTKIDVKHNFVKEKGKWLFKSSQIVKDYNAKQ